MVRTDVVWKRAPLNFLTAFSEFGKSSERSLELSEIARDETAVWEGVKQARGERVRKDGKAVEQPVHMMYLAAVHVVPSNSSRAACYTLSLTVTHCYSLL